MNFPREELVDMIYALETTERTKYPFIASRIYAQCYPERRYPQQQVFQRLKERFERTGNVMYEEHVRVKPVTKDDIS